MLISMPQATSTALGFFQAILHLPCCRLQNISFVRRPAICDIGRRLRGSQITGASFPFQFDISVGGIAGVEGIEHLPVAL